MIRPSLSPLLSWFSLCAAASPFADLPPRARHRTSCGPVQTELPRRGSRSGKPVSPLRACSWRNSSRQKSRLLGKIGNEAGSHRKSEQDRTNSDPIGSSDRSRLQSTVLVRTFPNELGLLLAFPALVCLVSDSSPPPDQVHPLSFPLHFRLPPGWVCYTDAEGELHIHQSGKERTVLLMENQEEDGNAPSGSTRDHPTFHSGRSRADRFGSRKDPMLLWSGINQPSRGKITWGAFSIHTRRAVGMVARGEKIHPPSGRPATSSDRAGRRSSQRGDDRYVTFKRGSF